MAINFTVPTPEEYAPFYADYVQRASQHNDIHTALSSQIEEILNALDALTEAQARFKPGAGGIGPLRGDRPPERRGARLLLPVAAHFALAIKFPCLALSKMILYELLDLIRFL